jgi:hypothetical protein
VLRSFDETWDLDSAHGYRLASHRYAFTFLVPSQGGDITVSQAVRADDRGVFAGSVALADARESRRLYSRCGFLVCRSTPPGPVMFAMWNPLGQRGS